DKGIFHSIGGLISYLKYTQKSSVERITQINKYDKDEFMTLPYSTKVNLELTETIMQKEKKGSLFWVIDNTHTPMGKRLLRNYLEKPLLDIDKINYRLNATESLFKDYQNRENLIKFLKSINDIERILTKVIYGNVLPRELLILKNSINVLPEIKGIIKNIDNNLFYDTYENMDTLDNVKNLIDNSIMQEPPATVKDGGYINDNFNEDVDKLRFIMKNSKTMLAELTEKIKNETGIKGLKISYNKVFGYFFEVTKSYQHLVPDYFVRRQTLANCERYITDDLKNLENEILNANDEILQIEREIYGKVCDEISNNMVKIQNTINYIATLDVITSFAITAFKNNYTKPVIDIDGEIKITDGRHPVVEKISNEVFVPNDTYMDNKENLINIITGPNMAGKSTYMRQVAIIVIMAQIGSFVPARYAKIGVVDKLFTRVGAYDDLSSGRSTFMVEMSEVAEILNLSTGKSLLILDEIGRGTSTYDGMSIAMSVIEYIGKKVKGKTLFSTHYHELTHMEEKFNYIKNYNVLVKKKDDSII
ncbi:MAG: DNA mismatch repair protein MutS, partial [Oscillospiraceae bacterium]